MRTACCAPTALGILVLVGCGSSPAVPADGGPDAQDASADSPFVAKTCTASPQLLSTVDDVLDMVQDASNLYGVSRGSIVRIPKDGSPATVLAKDLNDGNVQIQAVAVDDQYAYFTATPANFNPLGGYIGRVPLAGGPVARIAENRGVAFFGNLLVTGGKLFWAEHNVDLATGSVAAMPVAGGPVETISQGPTGHIPMHLELGGGFVWWVTMGDQNNGTSMGKQIVRAPLVGGPPEVFADPIGISDGFATNSTSVVYDVDVSLGVRPFAAPMPTTRLDMNVGLATDIAADDTNAWVIVGASGLFRTPLDGSSATEVDSDQAELNEVVVDDRCVYWSNRRKGISMARK